MHYTLCDQIADIVQNAVEAEATEITVELVEDEKVAVVYVRDNGKGIKSNTIAAVADPFYTDGLKHPRRKTGLGLAFLAQTVEQTGGAWKITSSESGTLVCMEFNLTHIDTPPMGDVPLLFRSLLLMNNSNGTLQLSIHRKKLNDQSETDYSITSAQLVDALGDLQNAQNLLLLETFLRSQEENG